MKPRLILIACLALMAGLLSAQNIFGAFQISTEPRGATITLYGTNQYLGSTPSQAIPVSMDQSMTYNWGVAGRVIDVIISKPGYLPIRQQIFVPFTSRRQRNALRNPTVFRFNLVRQQIQAPPYWPHWNPTSYYYFLNPGPGQGPGHHAHNGPGNQCGPGGGYHGGPGGGNNSGSHGSNNHYNGPSGGNSGPGHNPPSGGHAGNPRP